ncbi:nitroreductase family protein [Desulfomarina sp.]
MLGEKRAGMKANVGIDKAVCTGCGTCITVCPHDALELKGKNAVFMAESCFGCCHCRSVCPVDAVQVFMANSGKELLPVSLMGNVAFPGGSGVETMLNLMASRRSCRNYREDAVSLEILESLAEIGTTAPSGTNSQAWVFHIFPEREDVLFLAGLTADYYTKLNRQARNPMLRQLVKMFGSDELGSYYRNYHDSVEEALRAWREEGRDRLFHGAAAAILVTVEENAGCPVEDGLLATQNILLAAHGMGLGSCLIGFVVEALRRSPAMCRELGIRANEKICSVIALGYPDVTFIRSAGRRKVVKRIFCRREQV